MKTTALFISLVVFLAAVVGPDVRRGACGGERRTGAEPQPGDRSEAAQLHLPTHLAARDQPHELPAHGMDQTPVTDLMSCSSV